MSSAQEQSEPEIVHERSFEVLVAEYRPMLLSYLTGVLGEAHLAEDVTQETFLTAHKSLDKFVSPRGGFGAWLRGIARNKVREHHRASSRRPLVVDSRIVDGMEEVYSLFDGGDAWNGRMEVLRRCVAKLKEKLRSAIEAVYQRNRSLADAASELNSSAEAIGQRLTRARRLIRECVERHVPQANENG